MDSKIKNLTESTKIKFGLESYYLKRYSFDRSVNIFNETIYTLCMEWFPNHITVQEDEDLNPEGTAVIDIDVNSQEIKSVIFVGNKSFANGGIFYKRNKEEIIDWIELETKLTYEEHFQLDREEELELHFRESIDGVATSPAGFIEVKFDQEGKLTMFSVHLLFPFKKNVNRGSYTLTLEKIEHLAMEQLQLIEFPLYEEEQLFPVYAMEEVFITNDQLSTIPFEFFADTSSYMKVDETLFWDEPINKAFEKGEIYWLEHITAEQAFSNEPSLDTLEITEEERKKCVKEVESILRRGYATDSGLWTLKTVHRERGYIHVILRRSKEDNCVFQRKLTVIIDGNSLKAITYIDNKEMLEIFDEFDVTDKVEITKDEAYKGLKQYFELIPYYVYDFDLRRYILCGKLDCEHGVDAGSGKVFALDTL